jgi:hypothetical protein
VNFSKRRETVEKLSLEDEKDFEAWKARMSSVLQKSLAKDEAGREYLRSHGYGERPEGPLQILSPTAWSLWHCTTNWLMAAVILVCLASPIWGLITGNFDPMWLLVLPTLIVMARYAPLFTVVGLVPYWFLYAAVDGIIWGNNNSEYRIAVWLFIWYLYPLLSGLRHIKGWEEERKLGLPLHPVSDHPYATAAACIGTAVAVHHIGKKD